MKEKTNQRDDAPVGSDGEGGIRIGTPEDMKKRFDQAQREAAEAGIQEEEKP